MTVGQFSELVGNLVILLMLAGIPLYGFYRRIGVYDTFIEGAKTGFPVFLRIMPFMVAMLVAIGMLRASGFFDLATQFLSPALTRLGIPSGVVPVILIRPFSGSGALAALADLLHKEGGNVSVSHWAAVVASTTETTFYIIAVYFGAVGIRIGRHTLLASLLTDVAGIAAALWFARMMLL